MELVCGCNKTDDARCEVAISLYRLWQAERQKARELELAWLADDGTDPVQFDQYRAARDEALNCLNDYERHVDGISTRVAFPLDHEWSDGPIASRKAPTS